MLIHFFFSNEFFYHFLDFIGIVWRKRFEFYKSFDSIFSFSEVDLCFGFEVEDFFIFWPLFEVESSKSVEIFHIFELV